MSDYKNLEVYQKAVRLANDVYVTVTGWQPFDRWTLGKQLVASADSIAANIAEGYGRRTLRDRAYFLHVARGSARETECLLTLAENRNLLLKQGSVTPEEAEGIAMMLSKPIAALRARESNRLGGT